MVAVGHVGAAHALALRCAAHVLAAEPSIAAAVTVSLDLRNAREAWGVRELAERLAEELLLHADVRARDERVIVCFHRRSDTVT
jgi:hypothetical protein